MVEQGGDDVGGGVAFFEEAFDEVVLLFELPGLERGAEFDE